MADLGIIFDPELSLVNHIDRVIAHSVCMESLYAIEKSELE